MKRTKDMSTSKTFQHNFNVLKRASRLTTAEISKQSGVSERMVKYLLSGERTPGVDMANAIGKVFGVSGWLMIHPTFKPNLEGSKLEELTEHYLSAKPDGRQIIEQIAEREAKYR